MPVGGDGTSAACHHELDLEPLELIAVSMALASGWLGADLSQGRLQHLVSRRIYLATPRRLNTVSTSFFSSNRALLSEYRDSYITGRYFLHHDRADFRLDNMKI